MKLIAEQKEPITESGEYAFVLQPIFNVLAQQLQKEVVTTQIAALRWFMMLHRCMPIKFFELIAEIETSLLRSLSNFSVEVIEQALKASSAT